MTSTSTLPGHRQKLKKERVWRTRVRSVAIASAILASASCGSPQAPPGERPPTTATAPPPATSPVLLGRPAQEVPKPKEQARPEATQPEAFPIARVKILPSAPRAGDTLTAEVESNDPSQNAFLAYRWFVNGEENPGWRGNTFAGSFKRGDEISVAVLPPGSSNLESALTDSVRIGNAPPQVEKLESPRFEDGKYSSRIVASDPEGDPLTFAVVKGPAGLAVDDAGRITWTPGENDLGRQEVVISIKDDSGGEIVYTYAFTVDRR